MPLMPPKSWQQHITSPDPGLWPKRLCKEFMAIAQFIGNGCVLMAKLSKYLDQFALRDICDHKLPSEISKSHTDWFFDLPEKPEQLGLI